MRKNSSFMYICIFLLATIVLIIAAVAVMDSRSSRIEKAVYNASITNITEVYTQVKKNFNVVSEEQWRMLELTADYIKEAGDRESDIVDYVNKWHDEWKFTTFFFLDESEKYYASNGDKGVVDLGTAWRELFTDGQEIVIDGSIPGKEALLFFAVPCDRGTFKGFDYSAIAIAYDMESLNKELGVNAFDEKSCCYIASTNGRIILKNEGADDLGGNLLFHLKDSSFTQPEIEEIRASFEEGQSGSCKYVCNHPQCNNQEYYMIYTPVGLHDWMLVACIESAVVDESTSSVEKSLIVMLAVLFGVFLFIVVGIIVLFSQRAVSAKNQKIWQQYVLFKHMSGYMNDVFILCDMKARKAEYISSNIERVLGITLEEAEQSSAVFAELLEDKSAFAVFVDKLMNLDPGETFEMSQVFVNRRTSERYNFVISAICEKESPELVSIIFSDRTKELIQRRQIEDALMVAESANKAKTVFLNNMSHDIRTPMNAIIGFTSLASSHVNEPDQIEEYLRKIMVSGEHLLSLINDVLDMSRIESGKVRIEVKETTLPVILHDLRNILQTDIKAKDLEFNMEAVDIVHENIICDKLRLNQILINLMSNAIKFTESGGKVGLRVIERPGAPEGYANYEFRVKDTGIGMSEEFIEHIFEPFTREETSTVSKIQGTGLGMAITKNIVDMMAGTIEVNSKVGEGSEFIVSFCFETTESRQELQGMQPHDDLKTQEEELDPAAFKGMRVLLADDVEFNREIAIELFEEVGIDVDAVENGREAVEMLVKSEPGYYSMIFMDVMMPVMDGYEATRAIRALDNRELAEIPIIATTANAFDEDVAAALDAGMNEHLAKPFKIDKFYEVVRKYMLG